MENTFRWTKHDLTDELHKEQTKEIHKNNTFLPSLDRWALARQASRRTLPFSPLPATPRPSTLSRTDALRSWSSRRPSSGCDDASAPALPQAPQTSPLPLRDPRPWRTMTPTPTPRTANSAYPRRGTWRRAPPRSRPTARARRRRRGGRGPGRRGGRWSLRARAGGRACAGESPACCWCRTPYEESAAKAPPRRTRLASPGHCRRRRLLLHRHRRRLRSVSYPCSCYCQQESHQRKRLQGNTLLHIKQRKMKRMSNRNSRERG